MSTFAVSPDVNFDFPGICFDCGPGWTATADNPAVQQIPTTSNGSNKTGSTFGQWFPPVLSTGLGVLGTVLGYKLQNNQINRGMYPSVGYQNGYQPTGQPLLGAGASLGGFSSVFIWLIIIIVGVVLISRLAK